MARQQDGNDGTGNADERTLARAMRDQIAGSLLPGDVPIAGPALEQAAAFLLEAARERPGDDAVVLVRCAEGSRTTCIAAINPDRPFLVDSIAAAIAAHGLSIDLLAHPIVPVRRDERGRLVAIAPDDAEAPRESMIYLETDGCEPAAGSELEKELAATLADVGAAVTDWPKMRKGLTRDAERLGDTEGAALLQWLAAGNLTVLGHVTRTREGDQAHRLGICRKSARALLRDDSYAAAFAWFDKLKGNPNGPLIVKANHVSRVHRRVLLDVFIVPVVEDGKVTALSVHAGIWTSAGLASPPGEVPVLREHLNAISKQLGFAAGSHDAKALVHALTSLPHDLVIGFARSDIARVATTMMALTDRPSPRLAMVVAPLGRHAFAFVWLPRDMLSTTVRLQVQGLLESGTGAQTLDWSLVVEGGNLALLRFVLDLRGQAKPDAEALDRQLQVLLRGWGDAVEAALADSEDANEAAALAARYAEAFPGGYRATYGAAEAARDIDRLRRLGADPSESPLRRDVLLYRDSGDAPDELRLKIYQLGGTLPLSDAVPALENFGFRVLTELPTELIGLEPGTIHDFRLARISAEPAAPLLERSRAIEAAIRAVLNGRAEDDGFNRLVPGIGLEAREADWLRALYRYLRQTNIAFTIQTVVAALRSAPGVTRALIDLFVARHDPAFAGDRAAAAAEAEASIRASLAQVTAINDDRLLRLYWAVMAAIVRTNAFAPASEDALAFKFNSAKVPGLPRPVPWREIFVYSRRVEGIHLRAGPVARGGLRWSDRRDDFRTEVLGLMKAQRVKNAVIVPTGAKGGFYPKQRPDPAADRAAWAEEGRASYQLFIRTLLSVTDNIVADKVTHPEGVVVHDGEDPYFVVAADKGTASFSDTANAIAEERGFWLGDAFASGGSKGYDHKAMGITARGAWISVQRHFLEMGIDVQTTPVRVVGCGDMSGDVFGNGMLLSKAIKLIAAFDHRHIFLDPDPDPAKSWAERQRLFALPRSSWLDYAPELISKGGGVFPRTQKRIPLSAEARAVLGIEAEELDPDGVIAAILKAPVDLLWFGGIGTYIKAAAETHAQVGDPANDALRVDGREVRAKVIGEGANLGVTQAGRIEFALVGSEGEGGRINTDFIDNSAGVDTSDNEVNIKIALGELQRSGKLSEPKRLALLRDMTDEIATLVLEDNRLQALALSLAEAEGAPAAGWYSRLIDTLEALGELDRRTEGLGDAETFKRRAGEGIGLTRPELAVLLSTAKLVLQDAVAASPLAQDEATVPLLLSDFPPQMQRGAVGKALLTHRLRREIVATVIANTMVNRMGLVHPFDLAEDEGAPLDHVAAAFVASCELLGMDALWRAIDNAAMPEAARLLLFDQAALALRGHMADWLRTAGQPAEAGKLIGELAAGVAQLVDHVDDLLAEEARGHAEAIALRLTGAGAPAEIATTVANLFAIDGAIGLARLSRDTGIAPVALTEAFIALGERLGLGWAQSAAALMRPTDPWERLLVAGLARDFQQMRFEFVRMHAGGGKAKADLAARIERWAAANAAAIAQFRATVARAQAGGTVAPAMLAHIASQARNLLRR